MMWRRIILPLSLILLFVGFFFSDLSVNERNEDQEVEKEKSPNDWFWRQRAYPLGYIDPSLRALSVQQARALQRAERMEGGATWVQRGPSNIGGRITALDISRQNPNILYAGAADGGVLKSTNSGTNWIPLSDDQPSLSIGALTVDPTNDNIIYAGTGEANSSGDSYDGVGVLKSTDGGSTWSSLGLAETRHIGKIVIDPLNTNTLYVAAMGTLFSGNAERGVYKSTDGGATWSHVLFVNDSTGIVDVSINPQNPNILLAAAWQRMRGPEGRRYVGGVHTGIYRTTDAGASWQLLSNGLPTPSAIVGRTSVAIAPTNPLVAYVSYADDPGNFLGLYKTTDGGDTWARTSDAGLGGVYSNFGWYFGNVFVSPFNENNVFVCGLSMGKTTNGGASWSTQSTSHPDNHAMAFHPTNPNILYIGHDGGLSKSSNGGTSWYREANQDLFITQFYAGYIDPTNAARSIGGTQDNGTPRTQTGNSADWVSINGGDGFYAVIDYSNSNNQYAESQYGGLVRTTNNWGSQTGASSGFNGRKNWSTPIVIDPHNPQVLYTGSHMVHKTTNGAATWVAISPDLSDGPVPGFSAYATITTIDVAKTDSNVIMAGTDDANVWATTNGGTNWTNISAGLPNRWITRVRFDPTDHSIAYVTLSGYRYDISLPHIFRTSNLGATWEDISSNLPEAPINVVLVDPRFTNRLYVGTDVGCYFTTNTGASWQSMGSGLPNVAISDMQLHAITRIARAFTHGRSMWEINLDQLVTSVENTGSAPITFELLQNYPNPFNPATTIGYAVDKEGDARLAIYDERGAEIRVLADGPVRAGTHSVSWDGKNWKGEEVAAGVYFSRLEISGRQQTKKMLLVK